MWNECRVYLAKLVVDININDQDTSKLSHTRIDRRLATTDDHIHFLS